MSNPQDDVAGEILEAVIRAVWAFRVELVLLAGAGMLWYLGHHLAGPIAASAALAAVVALVLVVGPTRRPIGRLFRHARLRRKWRRAIQAAHIPSLKNRVPAIRRIRDIPAGERFDVRIPPGSTVPDLDRAAEVIAAALGVREIRVRRNADNASRGEVAIARRDPLADASLPWPHQAALEASLWDPIPVGIDEDGNVRVKLAYKDGVAGVLVYGKDRRLRGYLTYTEGASATIGVHDGNGKLRTSIGSNIEIKNENGQAVWRAPR